MLDFEVWFCHKASSKEQADAGFGVAFDWDTPLLDGYNHRFLQNVSRQPSVNSYLGLDTPEVADLIQNEKPDALLVNGWHYKSAWQAMRKCWRTETPLMVRSDSHLRTQRSAAKRLAKWPYYRWFIPKLDACLAVGSWSRDYFLHYGAPAERVFTVPHVIDSDFFSKSYEKLKPQRQTLRETWGLNADSVVFIFAGKFIEKKRPMDFIRSIELASAKESRVVGLMVGDGELKKPCEAYVQSKNLPIRFAGFLNQTRITESYVAADALVLPSDGGETWGLVVNEAMTCGLPCFVSDHVGCGSDLVAATGSGAVFPLGDSEAIANLLNKFAKNAAQRGTMSDNALRTIAKYSAREAVSGTLAALAAVVDGSPEPGLYR
jgi:glycosyltransferase involved in cell wall biosynthesis